MLSFTLISAFFAISALAGSAVESPPFFPRTVEDIISLTSGLDPNGPIVKSRDQLPLNPPICPFNAGPFFFLFGFYTYELAVDACAAYGWRLAMLTEENAVQMSQVMTNCGPFAWLAGGFGIPADPCAIGISFGGANMGVFTNWGTLLCSSVTGAVMCEEIPQETISQTTTVYNTTIAFGETTTTATQLNTRTVRRYTPDCSNCQKPFSSDCSSSSDSSSSSSSSSSDCGYARLNGRGRHHKMLQSDLGKDEKQVKQSDTAPVCYGENCLPVCNSTINGIHVILGPVSYANASAECAKYGWSMLDFTQALTSDLAKLSDVCTYEGFVNSINGVKAFCPFVQPSYYYSFIPVALAVFPASDSICENEYFKLPVYCQERCPFDVSDSGLEIGQVSLTTDLASTTATLFTPSTTVVISKSCTETVFVQQP